MMGGILDVTTSPAGSTFTVSVALPIDEPSRPWSELRDRRILLVEDRSLVAESLAELVRERGGAVQTVGTWDGALLLAPNAVVVSLSPFDGPLAREADILVPGRAPLEAWDEVLPTADASVASYAVSAPVFPAAPGATDAVAFVQALASRSGQTSEKRRTRAARERVAAIRRGRGRLVACGEGGLTTIQLPPRADALVAGGCWIDDPEAPAFARPPLPECGSRELAKPREEGAGLVAFAAGHGGDPPSPLLTKLTRSPTCAHHDSRLGPGRPGGARRRQPSR
jgi:hypothetical protein